MPSPSRHKKVLRILYLFAGERRKNDIRAKLEIKCKRREVGLILKEVDLLLHGEEDNMLDDKAWHRVMESIDRGDWDLQIVTPPCSDFSRVKYANKRGPRPTRSRQYPRGYPWLKGKEKQKTMAANLLVDRSLESIRRGRESKAHTKWLFEHPEDLGDTPQGAPASVWQWSQMIETISEHGAIEGAMYQ